MSQKFNAALTVTVIFFIVATAILFTLDSPYWYFAILTLTIAILIPIIKAMWLIAGWADKKLRT